MKEKNRKIFPLPLTDTGINRIKGLTLVEVMIVFGILTIILASLFYTLNVVEQTSYKIGLEKLYLDLELRRAMDWITKDVRQTTAYNIKSNNPTAGYIKFNQVIGADTNYTNSPLIFSSNYIEYNYFNNTIMRNLIDSTGNIERSWIFNLTFTQPPFYTYNSTTKEMIPLDADELQKCGKLIINLVAQKSIKNLTLSSNLTQEIIIRNNE